MSLPDFRLTINGLDATTQVRDRLVSINIVDEAGQVSDTLEVVLDDRDAALPTPPEGAGVSVQLGFKGSQLVGLGDYVVDEVEFSDPPRSMILRCSATAKGAATAAGVAAIAWEGAGAVKGLLGYIYAREGGYDSFNRGSTSSGGEFPGGLSSRTIGDVIDLQRSGQVFAVGAAQFTPGVLDQAMREAGLKRSDQFSPANQDRMATALLVGTKRPALAAYLKGESDNLTAAHQDLCQEWAGVVCPNGRGAYDGDAAGNRASGEVADVQAALQQARGNLANKASAEAAAEEVQPPGSPAITGGQRTLLKDRHSESWHDTTFGRIFTTIAKRHGLTPVIQSEAAEREVLHEDQTNESDQAFLTRLAEKYDAVVKPKQGQLLMADRNLGTLFTTNTVLKNTEVTTWRARLKDRARYSEVRARWLDRKTSTEKMVEHRTGQGYPTFELQKVYRTEADAQKAAASKSAALAAATVEITITRPGVPQLAAESKVTLEGFRADIDGKEWVVNRVQHTLDASGLRTTIECGTPRENRVPGGSGYDSGSLGLFGGGPVASGTYVQGNVGPTSTGPHFDIKRADGAYFDRGALDKFVEVNGGPLSAGTTVPGGRFGASRSYGTHRGWDFAFGPNAQLRLKNGAEWIGNVGTENGDKASFRTPDGTVYSILHGRFQQ